MTEGNVKSVPTEAPKKPRKKPQRQEPKLVTDWAKRTSQTLDFDREQSELHAWVELDATERLETLLPKMTIADAEALMDSAIDIAQIHEERATAARNLANEVSERLGREIILRAKMAKERHDSQQKQATALPVSTATMPTGIPALATVPKFVEAEKKG